MTAPDVLFVTLCGIGTVTPSQVHRPDALGPPEKPDPHLNRS